MTEPHLTTREESSSSSARKPRPPRPLTERLEASRSVKKDQITMVLLHAAVLSRIWPSFLTMPIKRQRNFGWLLCIDSPAGRLAYRVTDEELPLFDHLERKENDFVDCGSGDKLARLLHLATEDWK